MFFFEGWCEFFIVDKVIVNKLEKWFKVMCMNIKVKIIIFVMCSVLVVYSNYGVKLGSKVE